MFFQGINRLQMGGKISGRTSEEAEGILSILRGLRLESQSTGPFWSRSRVFQASKDGRNKKKEENDVQFFFGKESPFHKKKFIVPQCYIETKLNIIVDMSLEMPVISLTGRGIEKSLNIIKSEIQFNPVIPFTVIQEIDFTIENTCHYPVEFFWHHLDE